jgi:hypothetical protein
VQIHQTVLFDSRISAFPGVLANSIDYHHARTHCGDIRRGTDARTKHTFFDLSACFTANLSLVTPASPKMVATIFNSGDLGGSTVDPFPIPLDVFSKNRWVRRSRGVNVRKGAGNYFDWTQRDNRYRR